MNDNKDRFISSPDADASGSLQGYITASYEELKSVFGEPGGGDGYKTSTEWTIVDSDTGAVICLYDYKETNLYDDPAAPTPEEFRQLPSYDWHVGTEFTSLIAPLARFLSKKIGRTVEHRCWF